MHMRICIHLYVCTRMWVHLSVCVCMQLYVHMYMYICCVLHASAHIVVYSRRWAGRAGRKRELRFEFEAARAVGKVCAHRLHGALDHRWRPERPGLRTLRGRAERRTTCCRDSAGRGHCGACGMGLYLCTTTHLCGMAAGREAVFTARAAGAAFAAR